MHCHNTLSDAAVIRWNLGTSVTHQSFQQIEAHPDYFTQSSSSRGGMGFYTIMISCLSLVFNFHLALVPFKNDKSVPKQFQALSKDVVCQNFIKV